MTFPDTIPANIYPVPTCPSWCPSPAGHDDGPETPGNWTRYHVAFLGVMTYRDYGGTAVEIEIRVAAFEANSYGADYVCEAPRVWISGVNHEEPLTADEMATFADLIHRASTILTRITG